MTAVRRRVAMELNLNLRHPVKRRGVTIIYIAVALIALIGFTSLAVDLARVQTTKTELHRAAEAAARYGAMGLPVSSAAAIANAITSAADNTADGSPVVLLPSDVLVGNWNSALTPKFSTSRTPLNSIQVTCVRSAARGNATPLLFGVVLGKTTCDINVSSTATVSNSVNLTETVLANGDPWLAGEPTGTQASLNNPHNDPDTASIYSSATVQQGLQYYTTSSNGTISLAGIYTWSGLGTVTMSTLGTAANYVPTSANGGGASGSPQIALGMNLTAGTALTFTSISGNANYNNSTPVGTADGDSTTIVSDINEDEHGMSNVTAPIDSLIGVFLNDSTPDSTAAPADLDFSTAASRNFTTLSPKLKQPFFIGDGLTDNGNAQQFVVPQGATRLFFGNMDAYEWSNNVGSFSVSVHSPVTVTTVQ